MSKDIIDLDEHRFNINPIKHLHIMYRRFETKQKELDQLLEKFKSETIEEGLKWKTEICSTNF